MIPALACLLGSSLFAADDSIRGFVSVEPFEVRLEAIVKVEAFRVSWRLEGETISVPAQQGILDNVSTLLESGVNLVSSDADFDFTGKSIRFVQPDPEKGYATDERDEIPVGEALVGITLSSAARNVRSLEIEWLWFAPEQDLLVLEIASRGKPSARFLTPKENSVSWKLEETIEAPTMLTVPEAERIVRAPLRHLLFVGIAMLVLAAVMVIRLKQKAPAWVGWLTIGGIVCGFLSFKVKVERLLPVEETKLEEVTYGTLRNIYHAFDFRDESEIYDTLEKSVSGLLLEEVYLEIRQSLELENTGGPRVRVYEIALRDTVRESLPEGVEEGFRVRANWATIGEVTHWGHTHERTNRYEAVLTFHAPETRWKVADLELLNEERVQKVSRRAAQPVARPVAQPVDEAEPEAAKEP